MGFRWYGEDNDKISLADIKQIPGVTSIVWALHHKLPGEVWTVEEIAEVQKQLEPYGFNMDVVESVNVHDDIKIGLPSRDQYIENYIQTIKNLSKFGVKVICYNFMPIFDWTRTDLFHPVGDGSTALYYEAGKIHDDPKEMADYILNNLHGMTFPGWEPERMEKLDELFAAYKPVTKEVLWENLKYFLEALMPTCKECDIKMAIHMDDPPWDIFGLPRLLTCEENIDRFLKMVDSPYNCLTLCSGSLNADPRNNVADIVRKHCDRIAFAHIRNVKHFPNGDFSEASHRDCDGDTGILDILKADLRVISVRITDATSGMKSRAMSVRVMAYTTVHWVLCICSACGICSISWMKINKYKICIIRDCRMAVPCIMEKSVAYAADFCMLISGYQKGIICQSKNLKLPFDT